MTHKTIEDKRTQRIDHAVGYGLQLPVIAGYTVTRHAAIRMAARMIDVDQVHDALTRGLGRPHTRPGVRKYTSPAATVVVNTVDKTIITVGHGCTGGAS